ncbi:PTS system mannose/fructose/sorbose family transporter subunit IID [Proteiniclasticum sp. SCR006]|uniref:PTS system mannose/fructose/sorbose family transporter subunit IID n=1 Tax=Proteiniclasticum aestuarii TaxID=2817862 RepID=A0A939HCF3_9CLOT|nr:PTS system mannose/fructose/sorbose family transporter subunit IID [Proteiniclasticum aestuarii]MBO1265406.1 PTS system mannose/fructose/sorbose family transporter subunit IID [Proteiniclasticum aestuarii]
MNNELLSPKEEKKMLRELFLSSFVLEASYNYERQQSLGFAVGMWPAIKRFYKTKEKQAEALQRHLAIFNITPHLAPTVTGVATAMEAKASQDEEFDASSINSIKVGLMGPLSGIGDSIFWGTLRVITVGIGVSLAKDGNILGPILFLLLFNVPHLLVRYFGLIFGYRFGTNLISSASESGIITKMSKAATIVGLTVIGAMSASMVKMKTALAGNIGGVEFEMQSYLDQIFPLLLPLLYTLFMFWMLKKNQKPTTLLLTSIAIGIIGVLLQIL